MDSTVQWPQDEIGLVKPMEEMVPSTTCSRPPSMERKVRPHKDQALNCPRCNSINTKFCYYNNYSLTQPRYFCKTCRRYWTEGGSLRNVPVGGGSRKNKRSSSSSSISSKKTLSEDLNPPTTTSAPPTCQNPKIHEGQDLNLAFQTTQEYHNMSHDFVELPNIQNSGATIGTDNNEVTSTATTASTTASTTSLSALELLRTGMASKKFSIMPMPMSGHAPDSANSVYQSGFGLHDFKPSVKFPFDGMGNGGGYENVHGVQDHSNGRLLFPFEDLKPVNDFDQNRGQGDSSGYWNGMLGGGSW